ncbi:PepSY domain-containing protein [Colwellia sp. D2M02]|uniref:PepSY-associated TM helix domain-containing protein n=1 Tax=Colwellia sp. D2M02 TaxID=2841562 RepID=UPI001C0A5472|nr:PepSY-associated TM helix domain-containing protein [Colwellia sp. D2M02]MBU2892302.1 PepSY domain-containing protein [Colwellia sp. D2M02]
MKDTFRQSMKWLHTWVGLVVGWVLFFMFLTGTLGYFYQEITRWMQPERPLIVHEVSTEALLDRAQQFAEIHAKGVDEYDILLPSSRDQNLRLGWRHAPEPGKKRGRYKQTVVDIESAENVATRETGGGRTLYRMHYRLHYMDTSISYWLVGFCTMLMLLAVITGVVIHKKIFSDFFTFRAKKGLPGWLDSHNALSVIALPFHFMITYSGLLFFLFMYMGVSSNFQTNDDEFKEMRKEIFPRSAHVEPAGIPAEMRSFSSLYDIAQQQWQTDNLRYVTVHAPNDINAQIAFVRNETDITYNQGDEVVVNGISGELISGNHKDYTVSGVIHNGFYSLHEGQFAGTLARWVYFITGLIGTAMIASGLVLWTTKRKPQQMKKLNGPDFGYRLVEQLNIGTIVGLPIAIAAYFYANRLLPVTMENRGEWEVHIMFITWALLLLYPAIRPAGKAWLEQLQLASIVFILLPMVNALTTDKHLGVTLPHGDWNLAGFDLTLIAVGISFAFARYKMKVIQQSNNARRKPTKSSIERSTNRKSPLENTPKPDLVLTKTGGDTV